ncbi:MAG: hypothetical protein Q4D36_08865, partial [Bacteroidales bacterium]|nr:hypothetical protein [Bacteroidales bacterium]
CKGKRLAYLNINIKREFDTFNPPVLKHQKSFLKHQTRFQRLQKTNPINTPPQKHKQKYHSNQHL